MLSPVIGNLPINAIVFGTRGNAARKLDELVPRRAEDVATGRPSYWRVAASAGWAGLCQCVVATVSQLLGVGGVARSCLSDALICGSLQKCSFVLAFGCVDCFLCYQCESRSS